jgi:HK97 family phage major capsid protein
MKKTSLVLKEQREAKLQDMETLLQKAKNEAGEGQERREFTEAERSQFDGLESEINDLDARIGHAERIEAQEARVLSMKTGAIPEGMRETEEKLYEKFSIQRAISIAAGLEKADGREAEVQAIGLKEAKEAGRLIKGFAIPHAIVAGKRTLVTSSATQAGDLIKEGYSPIVEGLIPRLMLENLGAVVTTNNNEIVRVKSGYIEAEIEGEVDEGASKENTFTQATYKGVRIGAYTPVSRSMLIHDGYGLENQIRKDLGNSIRVALERTAINGTTIPGILGKAGIGNVALGDDGGLPEWVDILNLEAAIDAAFADMNNLKVLTTPYVKAYLKAKEKATNTGKFIWDDMTGVNTYPGYTTTLVPATLTKGNATSKCSAMILGDFSKLELAQFGGMDMVVDIYSQAKYTIVGVYANTWWNTIIDYPEAFAAILDIDLSLDGTP